MNDIDKKNRDIAFDTVKNNFGLAKSSLDYFKKELYEPWIDPKYKSLVESSPDLRLKVQVDDEPTLESRDEGWRLFKECFYSFVVHTGVSYSEFRKNRIFEEGKKQFVKIRKSLLRFYNDDSYEIDKNLERIGCYKIPNSEIYVVLSLNFVDWLLSATAESWTSCLNLESDYGCCFWTGLPGLIGDKNRALLYVTDGKQKTYNGMIVDRIISRSWVLLDDRDKINLLKYYPTCVLDTSFVGEILKTPFGFIEENFVSKYPVKLMFFENKKSCFIYKDLTKFSSDFRIKYYPHGGTYEHLYEGLIKENSIFEYRSGLSKLIKFNKSITNIEVIKCYGCEVEILFEEGTIFKNKFFCDHCYEKNVLTCGICEEKTSVEEIIIGPDRIKICLECYKKYYKRCTDCGKIVKNEYTKTYKDEYFCLDCFDKNLKECSHYGKEVFTYCSRIRHCI